MGQCMVKGGGWPPKPGEATTLPAFRQNQKWHSKSAEWYRVHRYDAATGQFGPDQFNNSLLGNARFSPLQDPATDGVIPTIYAAGTKSAAIAEVILHEAPTPSRGYIHDWQGDCSGMSHLSAVTIIALDLVDLTALGLKGAGLRVSDLFDGNQPDYPRTRAWALYIWQTMPSAQGLWWMSVRDNTTPVIMLFGDRCPPSCLEITEHPKHIRHFESEVISLLEDMQATMAP